MKLPVIFLACCLLQGCATVASVDRPVDYSRDRDAGNVRMVGEATQGPDEQTITKLLAHTVALPPLNRIAILKLNSDSYWQGYSREFTDLNDTLVENLVLKLRKSDRVYDASFLPGLLIPDKATIPSVRESAARFQADLLLAYNSRCQSYRKYRLLSADKSQSYCAIEAILLDIRSGIVAKSVVSTEDVAIVENQEDINLSETIRKSELQAVSVALGKVADEIITYLQKAPVL